MWKNHSLVRAQQEAAFCTTAQISNFASIVVVFIVGALWISLRVPQERSDNRKLGNLTFPRRPSRSLFWRPEKDYLPFPAEKQVPMIFEISPQDFVLRGPILKGNHVTRAWPPGVFNQNLINRLKWKTEPRLLKARALSMGLSLKAPSSPLH